MLVITAISCGLHKLCRRRDIDESNGGLRAEEIDALEEEEDEFLSFDHRRGIMKRRHSKEKCNKYS